MLACLLTLMSLAAPATAADLHTTPVNLIVLNPDGTPAEDVLGVATVIDGITRATSARPSYFFRSTGSGALEVRLPATDPYILNHLGGTRLFNVQLELYTFGRDKSAPEAFQTVHYVLNVGNPSFPPDPVGVDGSVVRLVPAPARSNTATTADEEPWRYPEQDFCTVNQINPEQWSCHRAEHPLDVRGERVVLGHNVGAGVDVTMRFTVHGTFKETTTTVTGVNGAFVEARGGTSLSNYTDDRFGFHSSGVSSPNEDPSLYVDFARFQHQGCFEGTCFDNVTYLPDRIVGQAGLLPTSETIYHDYARNPGPGNLDCTVSMDGNFYAARGTVHDETWSFGFNVGGDLKVMTLRVNSLRQNVSSNDYSNAYEWQKAATPSRRHQHLFVRGGHLGADADTASRCPVDSPGSTWTDSSDNDKRNPVPPPPPIPPTPEQAEPVREPAEREGEEGQKRVSRCTAAPERCGRDG